MDHIRIDFVSRYISGVLFIRALIALYFHMAQIVDQIIHLFVVEDLHRLWRHRSGTLTNESFELVVGRKVIFELIQAGTHTRSTARMAGVTGAHKNLLT